MTHPRSSKHDQETPRLKEIEYDDWGTICCYFDTTGVVNVAVKDPISMTLKPGIPGKGIVETKFIISGKPIETQVCRSDGATHGKTSYRYESWDRITEQKDSLDRSTNCIYDIVDRVVEALGPDGSVSSSHYESYICRIPASELQIECRSRSSYHDPCDRH